MNKPVRKAYAAPVSSWKNWDEVFLKPRDISCETFQTGNLAIQNKFMLNLAHPEARDMKREVINVPVYCSLVHLRIAGQHLDEFICHH